MIHWKAEIASLQNGPDKNYALDQRDETAHRMTDVKGEIQALLRFYWVDTPSVFCELALPRNEDEWTDKNRRAYEELHKLAEAHGTPVLACNYPNWLT